MEFQLHYTEQGQGTPFVLLHGNGESSDYFLDVYKRQVQQLKDIIKDIG